VSTGPVSATTSVIDGEDSPAHVIIIGGGFGGLALVRRLAKARRRGQLHVRVTLIDRRNHHTFQPLLYQVATAGLQTQDVGISLRAILRRRTSRSGSARSSESTRRSARSPWRTAPS